MTLHLTGYKCTAPPEAYRIRTEHADDDLDALPEDVLRYMNNKDIGKLLAFIESSKVAYTAIYFWITND